MTGKMKDVICFSDNIVPASFRILEVGLVEAAHHTVIVVIDHRHPEGVNIGTQGGVSLRHCHAYRVAPILGGAGEIC